MKDEIIAYKNLTNFSNYSKVEMHGCTKKVCICCGECKKIVNSDMEKIMKKISDKVLTQTLF